MWHRAEGSVTRILIRVSGKESRPPVDEVVREESRFWVGVKDS